MADFLKKFVCMFVSVMLFLAPQTAFSQTGLYQPGWSGEDQATEKQYATHGDFALLAAKLLGPQLDIQGSPTKEACIKALEKVGITLPGGLHKDETLTIGDFAYLLSKVFKMKELVLESMLQREIADGDILGGRMTVLVLMVEGNVTVERSDAEGIEEPAYILNPLAVGDIVRTYDDSRAVLKVGFSSVVRLSPNTSFKVRKCDVTKLSRREKINLELPAGKITAQVKKLRVGSEFKVATPVNIITVHGTLFSTSFYPKAPSEFRPGEMVSRVATYEGRVVVDWTGAEKELDQELFEEKTTINSGEERSLMRGDRRLSSRRMNPREVFEAKQEMKDVSAFAAKITREMARESGTVAGQLVRKADEAYASAREAAKLHSVKVLGETPVDVTSKGEEIKVFRELEKTLKEAMEREKAVVSVTRAVSPGTGANLTPLTTAEKEIINTPVRKDYFEGTSRLILQTTDLDLLGEVTAEQIEEGKFLDESTGADQDPDVFGNPLLTDLIFLEEEEKEPKPATPTDDDDDDDDG